MDVMLKISAVIMTTSVFAGLLIAGPSGLASTTAEMVPVKVKTFVVRRTGAPTRADSFELPAEVLDSTRFLRRAAVASNGRGLPRA